MVGYRLGLFWVLRVRSLGRGEIFCCFKFLVNVIDLRMEIDLG